MVSHSLLEHQLQLVREINAPGLLHHKTSPSGGIQAHEFPDPDYFKNCNAELDGLGVLVRMARVRCKVECTFLGEPVWQLVRQMQRSRLTIRHFYTSKCSRG